MSQDNKIGGLHGPSPEMSEEDQDDVRRILKKFQKLRKHRAKYDNQWLHYYKMFRGDQWDGMKMPRHRQKEVINMIWQTIQSNLPLQTDIRPEMNFIPEEPTDQPFAEILDDVSDSDWQRNNWLHQVTEVILDGYLYGIGYGYMGYDDDADFGVGSAEFYSVDPFYCYPDTSAKDVNCGDSEIFIVAEPVCTEDLKRDYPEWADQIKSDVRNVVQSSKAAINDFKVKTQNSDLDMPDATLYSGSEQAEPRTLKITAYMKPKETEEIEEVDEATEQVKIIKKKKYPMGRKVCIASGIKLDDEPLPFAHGKFPFAKYNNYILPREFFGVSEVEQLASPQRVFNKLVNASLEVLNLMGNPIWVVDTSSGVDPYKLVNKTGLVVQKEPNSEVRREMGVQLSGTALSFIDRMESWFNNVAGSQDVSRGQTPGSVTAASAIEQLQEAARTRIRQKQRNLDKFIRDIGQQYAEIVLEKYSVPRIVRVTNSEAPNKYFKMHIEETEEPMTKEKFKKALIRKYEENDGVFVPDNETRELLISGRFDVRPNAGSSLPFSIADKEAKALNLFDRGIIDEEEVLKTLDYPNREAVLARLQERKAEMAAQQQGA